MYIEGVKTLKGEGGGVVDDALCAMPTQRGQFCSLLILECERNVDDVYAGG